LTIAVGCAPPLIVLGEMVMDVKTLGATVSWPDAEPPFSDAVIVTGVEDETCPADIWNCVQARFAGIVTVAGTGAATPFELVSAIDVAAAGAADNCSCTQVVVPLVRGFDVNDTDVGVGGAELTVNVPAEDQAVTAAVVGDASP
jgi:hypothetical protein